MLGMYFFIFASCEPFNFVISWEFQNINKIEHTSRWFLSCNNQAKT